MELSGRRYGHIRVNEIIGEGGMGSVYAGFDETLHRRVAVKVLQDEQRLDPEARGRLIREARSLSRLDHPNICRIHDYIQDEAVDLLVLEFIEGRTLRTAIGDGLSHAERLRIAIAIADVLVAAHRTGIIHRDLKPENVMLTHKGEVKVLDFGLARWTEERTRSIRATASMNQPTADQTDRRQWVLDDRTLAMAHPRHLTAAGITVGTPLFMSPEQARGEMLTPASDMHSFGLVLQTLFTGNDPYEEDLSARAVLLKAASNASLPVTGVERGVTALISDLKQFAPTDRPTAAEVLRRLRHIETRPRRVGQAATAAVLMLLIILGVTKYTIDLRRERAAAVEARQLAVMAEREAAMRRGQAEDLITFMLGDLRKKLEPVGRLDVLDDVGERALAYAASLKPELMSADELARSAKALGQLGEVRISQGRLAEATPIFSRSLEMAQAAVRKEPKNQNAQLALMTGHFWVGESARHHGRTDESLREMQQYLATAQSLAWQYPANAEYRIEQAYAHANVGTLLMGDGRYGEAGKHFEESLRIKRARLVYDPANVEWRADLANTINKLGINLQKTGDLAGARAQFEAQKQIRERLLAAEPDNAQSRMRLAFAHGHLATVLVNMGDIGAAERELAASLAIERALAAKDPENADWRRNLAMTSARLAVLPGQRGTAEAGAGLRSSLAMLEDVVRRDPARVSFRGDLAVARARSVMSSLRRGDIRAAREAWKRIGTLPGMSSAADTQTRQLEVLLAGVAVARASGDARQLQELTAEAERVLSTPPLQGSADPEVVALRARLLVETARRNAASPLIARLDALGFHHPDYEWTVRGH